MNTRSPLPRTSSEAEPTTGLSRREFLHASMRTAGALLVGFHLPLASAGDRRAGEPLAPNAFIRIDRTGAITLVMSQAEMGQGIFTAIAMILAEELDARWDQVHLEAAPPSDKLYGNPFFG